VPRGAAHGIIGSVRVRTCVLVLLLPLMATVACTEGLQQGEEALRSPSVSSSGEPPVSESATAPPTTEPPTEGERIVLERPVPDSEILSPVLVRGTASVSSGRVAVRVLDAGRMELAAIVVDVSCGADCRGTFEAQLAFFVPSRQEGTVEVSEVGPPGSGAEGGSPRPVEVPVTLVPGV